jgi:hypothetical protein
LPGNVGKSQAFARKRLKGNHPAACFEQSSRARATHGCLDYAQRSTEVEA